VADVRWLDEREARAWRGYVRMNARLSGAVARQLMTDAGLSDPDYAVLVALSEAPEHRLRPRDLAREVQWEKSRLSHHLARMERRCLVAREGCSGDARGAFVRITETGLRAIRTAAPAHVDAVRNWFIDPLTPEQLDTLADISDAVLARLDGEPGVCDIPAEPCEP